MIQIGYGDDLLSLGNLFNPNVSIKYGITYKKNATSVNEYVVSNGQDNIAKVGQIENWNNIEY